MAAAGLVREECAPSLSELAGSILSFMAISERLKCELRHSWLSSGRRESVAEHSWNMALMVLLVKDHLAQPVDTSRTMRIALVHDLVEAKAGDTPATAGVRMHDSKPAREQAAMRFIKRQLDAALGNEIEGLWLEYEAGQTAEARLAKALDKLEVQIQHNLADLKTWEPAEYKFVYTRLDQYCSYDDFLASLCEATKLEAERKWIDAGIDPELVRETIEIGDALLAETLDEPGGPRYGRRRGVSHDLCQLVLFDEDMLPAW